MTDKAVDKSKNHSITYFASIKIIGLKCFKNQNSFNLLGSNGRPFQWTVILGNNNTGKTSILRAIAELSPVDAAMSGDSLILVTKNAKNRSEKKEFSEVVSSIVMLDNFNISNNISEQTGKIIQKKWGYSYGISSYATDAIDGIIKIYDVIGLNINGYGTTRRIGSSTLKENEYIDESKSLFSNDVELLNTEEWLLRLEFARKNQNPDAAERLQRVKEVLTSEIFPDVQDFRFTTDEQLNSFVEVKTDYGWIKISDLGYGYQASIAWMADFMKRMFDRYPDSDNPLREPAIVLIDEIDLHLHPDWQRKIIGYLSNIFPNTQFIVTSHSPLIVQSAENINLVILKKEGDHVTISQPDIPTFNGWTVEEILTELMGMDEKTQSDSYLKLMADFDKALDESNAEKAKQVYNELDKILHPNSNQRKLLRIQMSSLEPPTFYDKTAKAS